MHLTQTRYHEVKPTKNLFYYLLDDIYVTYKLSPNHLMSFDIQVSQLNATKDSNYKKKPYLLGKPFMFPKELFGNEKPTTGATMFNPTISIFIGFPSSSTLLYLLTAANASCLL